MIPNSRYFGSTRVRTLTPVAKVDIRISLLATGIPSGQHGDLPIHAKIVVKGADVGVRSRLGERDAEPCRWRDRCLRDAWLIFEESCDQPGVHVLLWGGDRRVQRTVGIGAHHAIGTAGWIESVLRNRTKGDGVPDFRIQIGPLHGVADVNRDRVTKEANHGKRLLPAGSGADLPDSRSHGLRVGLYLRGKHVRYRMLMLGMMLMTIRVLEQR